MAVRRLATVLGLSSTALGETVWGSVSYVYQGEKIPSLADGPYSISPLGANQMLDAGTYIRNRNVKPLANASVPYSTAPINGISEEAIVNSQMTVLSTSDESISASALAFMQGLYPPRGSFIVDAESELANGTNLGFPLQNYQYPNIGALSTLDYNYIGVAGNIGCNNYDISGAEAENSTKYKTQTQATQSFYSDLYSPVFAGLNSFTVNYGQAWELYEYALYQYQHDPNTTLTQMDMAQLYAFASDQQWLLNTPTNETTIPSIAGQTLAGAVLNQLSRLIASEGTSNKMTFLFGDFPPMLSFFALSGLSDGPSASEFQVLPAHGSMMSFELFSTGSDSNGTSFPDISDLMVRFLYRNGTGNTDLIEYSLFQLGNSEDNMPWQEFTQSMGSFSIDDVPTWCDVCSADTLFCGALADSSSNKTSSGSSGQNEVKQLSPAVGGVIGAVVTLAVVLLATLILGLSGFRLNHRSSSNNKGSEVGGTGVLKRSASATVGGFKGAEKLASDTDLRLKGAGAAVVRHERVGSWELRDSPLSGGGGGSGLDKDLESGNMDRIVSGADYGRRRSEDDDDHVDPFGDPVKPVDHV